MMNSCNSADEFLVDLTIDISSQYFIENIVETDMLTMQSVPKLSVPTLNWPDTAVLKLMKPIEHPKLFVAKAAAGSWSNLHRKAIFC